MSLVLSSISPWLTLVNQYQVKLLLCVINCIKINLLYNICTYFTIHRTGRVHMVQIQIEKDFLTSSFSILEDQPMDMLLGIHPSFIHPSFIHSSFIHSSFHSFVNSFILSSIHSFIHPSFHLDI